ncbi:MAG: hypothetical protein NVSMB23_14620 [Myxococcales bacterium]
MPPDDGTADVTITSLASGSTIWLDGSRNVRSLAIGAGVDAAIHPGSVAGSTLTTANGLVSRSTAGLVSVAIPLRGPGLVATGPSAAGPASAVFRLDASPLYAGRTSVVTSILQLGGGRVPDQSQLWVGPGGAFDLAGAVDLVAGLAGGGAVTNTAAGPATLVVAPDTAAPASFAGSLGAVLPGQANGASLAFLKLGRGVQALTGASAHAGGTQVQEGSLWLGTTGSLPAAGTVHVVGSSTQTALLGGVGSAGAISTLYSAVPGAARIQPGLLSSMGILRAASADLSHGALVFRLGNLAGGTAGVDFDQLDLGGGAFVWDADTDFVFDLSGVSATGGPAIVVQTTSQPALPPPSQMRIVNNPNGYGLVLSSDPALGLGVTVLPPAAAGPGFLVSPAHGLVTTQAGGSATFTVRLATQPLSDVIVALSSSDASVGQVAPASLTFTAANFATPQTATATGVVRAAPSGNLPFAIRFAPAISADPNYATTAAPAVSALSLDTRLLTVAAAPGLVTIAGQRTATFTVALAQTPRGPVTVALRSSDPAQGQPSPALLQFGPGITRLTVAVEGVVTAAAGCTPYSIVFAPSVSVADSAFGGLELPSVPLCNQAGPPDRAGPAALSLSPSPAAAAPGSQLALLAHVVNTGAADLVGARLELSPGGVAVESAAAAGAALVRDGTGFLLPTVPAGTALDATVLLRVTASPGTRAGTTAVVGRAPSDALSAPAEAWFTAAPLALDVGGCSCQSGTPGPSLAWIGLAFAAWGSRRRLRSASAPGADQLHRGRGVVPGQLGLPRPAVAQRVDAHHRNALLSLADHHVGAELSRGRHLDGAALDVDAAARLDLSRQREVGQVGLGRRPAHGEEHLAQRRRRLGRGGPREPADLARADLHLAAAALDGDRAAQRADRDGALAVRGDEEMAAAAGGEHVAVLDLQGDAALAGLDERFDAAADPRPDGPGVGPAQVQLAAVEDVDAHAVDRDLRLGICAGADPVGAEDPVPLARRRPPAVAPLQLDAAGPAEQHGAAGGLGGTGGGREREGGSRPRSGLARAEDRDPHEAAQRRGRSNHLRPYRAERVRASTVRRVCS